MATISAEKISEVRDRIDIERVVGRAIRLQKRGRRLIGLCPFHNEKTPSFGVDAEKKLYHCFGCGAGGDVFDFVMRIEGISFPEAVLACAKEAGVLIEEKDEDPRERDERKRRERLYQTNRTAADFYVRELEKEPKALSYLKTERGLLDETIQKFELGWAPDGWQSLTEFLESKRIDPRLGHLLGLLGHSEKGGRTYDRLRGRVVFPIAIPGGELAGFGSRRADWISDEGAKYLNSPESPIYDKSSILYGLSFAKDEIRKSRRAILVEGYLDVILLHQVGVSQAIASCGTALSAKHATILKKLAGEVVTMYDGDVAGQEATRKAAESLLREGVSVRVAELPEGDDPDTFARKHGAEGVKKLVEESPSAIDFFVARAKNAYKGGGIAGKAKAVDAVKPLLLAISDPLQRDVSIDACARVLEIEAHILRRHLAGRGEIVQTRETQASRPAPPKPKSPPPHVLETTILRRFVEMPDEVLSALEDSDAVRAFMNPAVQATIDAGIEAMRAGSPFDGPRALEAAKASGLADDDTISALRQSLFDALPERDDINVCVKRLLKERNDIRLRHLLQRLATEVDPQTVEALTQEADRLIKLKASL
jgi:DNA primase